MNCEQIEEAEIVEKYVTGQLGEREQADFELHFLGCKRCFEQVQLWQDMQLALAQQPRKGVHWWPILAVAASLLVAMGVGWLKLRPVATEVAKSSAPSTVSVPADGTVGLAVMASITPPHYSRPRWRVAGETGFDMAMQRYSKGDYAAAIPGLVAVLKGDQTNTAAQFFLGICYLMQGRDDEGIMHLQATIALGDSPELEEAHFYLAKALLRKQDASGAAAELRKALGMHGSHQTEEQSLLKSITEVPQAR
jgi:TolA-binding protein